MTAVANVIAEAPSRGIRLIADGDELIVEGAYDDRFVAWARRHKVEILEELLRTPKDLNALLDEARAGTDFTLKECKSGYLFSPLDLRLLVTGELTMHAARHFLEYQQRTVCRACLGGGCKACNFYGKAPYQPPPDAA